MERSPSNSSDERFANELDDLAEILRAQATAAGHQVAATYPERVAHAF